jgi:hypothetical protein
MIIFYFSFTAYNIDFTKSLETNATVKTNIKAKIAKNMLVLL